MHPSIRALFDELDAPLLVIDQQRRVQFTNRVAAAEFDFPLGERLPTTLDQFLSDAFTTPCPFPVRGAVPASLSEMTPTDDTAQLEVSLLKSPVAGEFLLLLRDTQALRFFNNAFDNLRCLIDDECARALEDFLASVQHVTIQLDQLPKPDTQQLTRQAREAARQGRALITLARRLSWLLEATASHGIRDLEPVDIPACVEKVSGSLRDRAGKRGITLKILRQNDTFGHVWANPGWIEQALLECLGNAVKFGEANHEITVELSQCRQTLVIIVSNISRHIPHVVRRNSLLPTFRTEPCDRGEDINLGIGLPLARRLVEDFGGSLLINLRPDGFFRCRIELPSGGKLATEPGISPQQVELFAQDLAALVEANRPTP